MIFKPTISNVDLGSKMLQIKEQGESGQSDSIVCDDGAYDAKF